MCRMIIGCSCENGVSQEAIKKLKIKTRKHSRLSKELVLYSVIKGDRLGRLGRLGHQAR